jgi:polysaccharide pyruvyl transferase WcaK-like protein
MIIEIYGAGFRNKGAQLMLRTVLERLQSSAQRTEFCMSPYPGAPYRDRAACGLQQIFPIPLMRRVRSFPGLFLAHRIAGRGIPKAYCGSYGLVRQQDIDALIDISGYAFGDVFPWRTVRNFATYAASFRKRDKPVIMLPQMFGPFQNHRVRNHFSRVLAFANVVYARDRMSLDHLHELAPRSKVVRQAPDVTIFAEPRQSDVDRNPPAPYAGIVPNANSLTKGKPQWAGSYIDRLVLAGRELADRGLRIYLILHGPAHDDLPLIDEISKRIGADRCETVIENDAFRLKAFISGARVLVASRYHSVVAALSTGVPSITLGWAHKYDTLHEEFGVSHLVHTGQESPQQLVDLINTVLTPKTWAEIHQVLVAKKAQFAAQNETMWQEVYAALQIDAGQAGE